MAAIPIDLVLDTPRCILRTVSEDDIPFVWSATRFPGFNDGMRWDAPAALQELVFATRRNVEMWRVGQVFTFTIVLKETGYPIGRIAIRAEPRRHDWSIGFWIHPEQWGRGFAEEAARSVIEFGFTRLGAVIIRAAHVAWNVRSRRVIEKLGMRFVRENPCGFEKNGKPVPEFEYALFSRSRAARSPRTMGRDGG
jgi:ribosomal-protein-alanine N-acetyltransferase